MNRLLIAALSALSIPQLAAAAEAEPAANEIVIVGTRSARPLKDSPVPVRVVDRAEIEAAGDTTAADAMERVVGVHIDTAVRTGQTPQIQGFESKHVLVLIDGRRASGRLADDFDLGRIPASSIERIEVLKGASSVLYGSDAIGGVINIVTRRPRRGLRGNAQISRDSLHRDDAALNVTGGNETVTGRFDLGHQRGEAFDLDPTDKATTGNDYKKINAQLEVAVRPSEKLELSTTLGSEDATSYGVGQGSGGVMLHRSTAARGRSVKVAAKYRPDEQGEVRLELGESKRVYGLSEDPRTDAIAVRHLDSTELSREVSLVGSRAFAEKHETVAGVESSRQEYESNQLRDGNQERLRTSGFAQHEWKPLTLLTLVPGIRYDLDSQFGSQMSKAMTMRIDPTDGLILRASYGEGYRAPSFSELYFSFENQGASYRVRGNPDLKPERSQNVQASVAWQATPKVWASLGVFTNRVHDLIGKSQRIEDGMRLIDYSNIESVRNQGVEASTRLRFTDALTLGLDYTFLRARDETRRRMLEGRPMHSGSLQARYDDKETGFSTAVMMNLVGRRPFYTERGAVKTTDWSRSYRSTTLRIGKKFEKTLELFAGVRNLSDETQETYHPVPPRSYFGGAGAEF